MKVSTSTSFSMTLHGPEKCMFSCVSLSKVSSDTSAMPAPKSSEEKKNRPLMYV